MPALLVAAGADPFGTFGGNGDCVGTGGVALAAGAGGGLGSAFAAARAEMPGSCCCKEGDSVGVVELGREIGSTGGGARICAASSIMRPKIKGMQDEDVARSGCGRSRTLRAEC